MISEFVREQKRYTQKDLCRILECTEEKAIPLIRKLKEFGVLKAVRVSDIQRDMSDLLDEDIEVADVEAGEDEYYYVFTFVGVIVVAGRVMKCYPKYLLHAEQPKEELRQVIKVLEKYNTKEQIVRMFNDSSESSAFNLLAVLLFLLQDYFENGVYNNTENRIESNGSGEILWDKTINETFTAVTLNPSLSSKNLGNAIYGGIGLSCMRNCVMCSPPSCEISLEENYSPRKSQSSSASGSC